MSKNCVTQQPAFIIIGGDYRTPAAQVRMATAGILDSVKNKGYAPVVVRVSDNPCTLAARDVAMSMNIPVRYGNVDDVMRKLASYNLPKDCIHVVLFQTPDYTQTAEALSLLNGCNQVNGTLTMWSVFHKQWMNSARNLDWVRGFNNKFLATMKSWSIKDKGAHLANRMLKLQEYPSLYKAEEKVAGAQDAKSAPQQPPKQGQRLPNVPVPPAAPADLNRPADTVVPAGKGAPTNGNTDSQATAANDAAMVVPPPIPPVFPVPPVLQGQEPFAFAKPAPVSEPVGQVLVNGVSPEMLLAYLSDIANYIRVTMAMANSHATEVKVSPADKHVYGESLVSEVALKEKQDENEILPEPSATEQSGDPAPTNRVDDAGEDTAPTNPEAGIDSPEVATSGESTTASDETAPVPPDAETEANRIENIMGEVAAKEPKKRRGSTKKQRDPAKTNGSSKTRGRRKKGKPNPESPIETAPSGADVGVEEAVETPAPTNRVDDTSTVPVDEKAPSGANAVADDTADNPNEAPWDIGTNYQHCNVRDYVGEKMVFSNFPEDEGKCETQEPSVPKLDMEDIGGGDDPF